jgi:molybdopterin-guanine dinucleotide biosynthesis protein A
VVAADMPRCDPELLARFLDLMGEHDAVIPETSGGLQPLHAVYAVSALPVLSREALAGRLSVVSACHLLNARIVGTSELIGLGGMPDLDTNLNIPDDLYD